MDHYKRDEDTWTKVDNHDSDDRLTTQYYDPEVCTGPTTSHVSHEMIRRGACSSSGCTSREIDPCAAASRSDCLDVLYGHSTQTIARHRYPRRTRSNYLWKDTFPYY